MSKVVRCYGSKRRAIVEREGPKLNPLVSDLVADALEKKKGPTSALSGPNSLLFNSPLSKPSPFATRPHLGILPPGGKLTSYHRKKARWLRLALKISFCRLPEWPPNLSHFF